MNRIYQMGINSSCRRPENIKPKTKLNKLFIDKFGQDMTEIIVEYLFDLEYAYREIMKILCRMGALEIKRWCFGPCPCLLEKCFPGIFFASQLLSDLLPHVKPREYFTLPRDKDELEQRLNVNSTGIEFSDYVDTYSVDQVKPMLRFGDYYYDECEKIDVSDFTIAILGIVYMNATIIFDPSTRIRFNIRNLVMPGVEHYWGVIPFPALTIDYGDYEYMLYITSYIMKDLQKIADQLIKHSIYDVFAHPVNRMVIRKQDRNESNEQLIPKYLTIKVPRHKYEKNRVIERIEEWI